MKVQFRITENLVSSIRADLNRRHPFAAERVGFIYCRFARTAKNELVVLAFEYVSVPDDQYIEDENFGAVIGEEAFRSALQHTYNNPVGIFHVHMHFLKGSPRPSGDDLTETAKFVPDFFHGRATVPHGAIILSEDALSGRIWMKEESRPKPFDEIRIIGSPLVRLRRKL